MTGVIATIPKYQFSSALGFPLVNGTLTTYLAGTTTLTSTWQDQALTALNTNPVVLDARGECVLWLDSTKNYKFVLKNALGVVQWTQDNLSGAGASADTLKTALATSAGAGMIGTTRPDAGASARTVQDKNQDYVDVTDFMSVAQIADARLYGYTLDCSAAFNAALVVGKGMIRLPPGGYIAKNLTIPAGVTIISVQGSNAVNNYYKRNNSTVIKTQGGDFIKGAAASMLFCARDIFIEGSGQTGTCFGSASAVETGFCFENVGISGFQYGFYAPQYSSSSFARDTSFSDCDYGLWSVNVSNNTKLSNMGYNRCANACRICGFGVTHAGSQISLGYTGANAGLFPVYLGYDLFTGLVNISDVYTEAYALDYSKNIIFNCRSSSFGDDHYKLDTFLSNGAGLRHLRVYSESLSQSIKSNLIEINGSVPSNCPNIETIAGQTGLIRGIKVNGRTFNSIAGRAVFDTYDVEAVIAAGTALNSATVTSFGSSAVTVVGFASTSIPGFADIINNANTTAATGRFYFPAPDSHHCPMGSTGKTAGLFEITAELAMDGLAAVKTYAVGVVYKVPGGGYTIKQVGYFRALARPGSALFDFSAEIKINVRLNTASSVGICFIPSATVDVPLPADITSLLYGRIRVRFIED